MFVATPPSGSRAESVLYCGLAALVLLAVIGHFAFPLTPFRVHQLLTELGLHSHTGDYSFADGRTCMGIANALDVLSNLPFALFGVWGFIRLHFMGDAINQSQRQLFQLFFIGLLLTTVGSMAYHLAPSDATLLWDRAGMAVAFAGVLGLAATERVGQQAGRVLAVVTLTGEVLALAVWHFSRDVLLWSVVQFGGMVLVIALARLRLQAGALGISLNALIVFYVIAKVFESTDHAVFAATEQWLSGHSIKHLAASLAALPVLAVLKKP